MSSQKNKPTKKTGKHPGGRPKKTTEDLPQNWKQIIIDSASIGMSDTEIRVKLGCLSNDLWYRLLKEDEEFSEAIKKAKVLCEAWWEEQGRVGLRGKDSFNHVLWYMNMKNRFKWHDRQELEHTGSINHHLAIKDFETSYGTYAKTDKK